jgi:hypothetical protein
LTSFPPNRETSINAYGKTCKQVMGAADKRVNPSML